jgi:hypothetical protein
MKADYITLIIVIIVAIIVSATIFLKPVQNIGFVKEKIISPINSQARDVCVKMYKDEYFTKNWKEISNIHKDEILSLFKDDFIAQNKDQIIKDNLDKIAEMNKDYLFDTYGDEFMSKYYGKYVKDYSTEIKTTIKTEGITEEERKTILEENLQELIAIYYEDFYNNNYDIIAEQLKNILTSTYFTKQVGLNIDKIIVEYYPKFVAKFKENLTTTYATEIINKYYDSFYLTFRDDPSLVKIMQTSVCKPYEEALQDVLDNPTLKDRLLDDHCKPGISDKVTKLNDHTITFGNTPVIIKEPNEQTTTRQLKISIIIEPTDQQSTANIKDVVIKLNNLQVQPPDSFLEPATYTVEFPILDQVYVELQLPNATSDTALTTKVNIGAVMWRCYV